MDLSAFSQVTSGGKAASDDTDGVERGEERGGGGIGSGEASVATAASAKSGAHSPPCSP